MFGRKDKHVFWAFGIAVIISLTIWQLGSSGYFNLGDEIAVPELTVVSQAEDDFLITAKSSIYEEKNYTLCGDQEVEQVDNSPYRGWSLSQMLATVYPATAGWQVEIINQETVFFYREINGFCREHAGKRHLVAKDGYVVIMYGPKGTDGGIAQITGILVDLLPEVLQNQVKAGVIEFDSHEQALQALDSFDEYH